MMTTVKHEAELKQAFTAELRLRLPGFYVLLHASRAAPDCSITGTGRTTFWECKHATPCFDSPGDQELMMMRLAAAGYARYVIWQAHRGAQRTLIVHPKEVYGRNGWRLVPEASCIGFDHRWLVDQIKKAHSL